MNFQSIYQGLVSGKEKLALVGLGYVGLPVAMEFAKYIQVIGYDADQKRISNYQNRIDITQNTREEIKDTTVEFTSDPARLREAKFIIVAVPTPTNADKTPDFTPLENASRAVGENLTPGSIVVFESTVYPGVTEELCAPLIERTSGLKCGVDWKIGYSPERINPGDQIHTFSSICKIVSGMDEESAAEIQKVYNIAVKAGTHLVSSIKTAEAVKIIENSQRDVNVAFMNECSRICDRTNIDTNEVLTAMNTKWNALGFQPGLVGGHCIGEDSYYLLKYAKDIKCDTPVLSHGRCLNEDMAAYIADRAVKEMSVVQKDLKRATVLILGITFKENCSDIRNSKVADLIAQLKSYQIDPIVTDECANPEAVQEMYGIKLVPFDELPLADCIIIAVGHHAYKTLSMKHLLNMYKKELPDYEKVLLDVKSIFDLETLRASGIRFWRL